MELISAGLVLSWGSLELPMGSLGALLGRLAALFAVYGVGSLGAVLGSRGVLSPSPSCVLPEALLGRLR